MAGALSLSRRLSLSLVSRVGVVLSAEVVGNLWGFLVELVVGGVRRLRVIGTEERSKAQQACYRKRDTEYMLEFALHNYLLDYTTSNIHADA
jgi:hypothetical protein